MVYETIRNNKNDFLNVNKKSISPTIGLNLVSHCTSLLVLLEYMLNTYLKILDS